MVRHFTRVKAGIPNGIAAVTAIMAAFLLGGFGGAGLLAGVSVTGVAAWDVGWLAMLGGLTGDTYGATNELAESAVLIAAVGLLPHGWIEPLPEMLGAF